MDVSSSCYPSPQDQIDALRRLAVDRDRKLREYAELLEVREAELAAARRQNSDLLSANIRFEERARESDRVARGRAWHMDRCGQIAGKALGYPWFKDDRVNFPGATEADGVCIGEHVADTIVEELANAYLALREAVHGGDLKYDIDRLVEACHGASVKAGWYTDLATGEPLKRNVPEMLCLIHSEISEAMEGFRKKLKDDKLVDRSMIEVELADAVIRIADLCGYLKLDLGGAVVAKMAFNATREDHRIENRKLAGGKAF